jgi:PPM family protein phosphatase
LMNATGITDIGLYREANQDRYTILQLSNNAVFAAVCDGMGGENGGGIASECAIETITSAMQNGWREDMGETSVKSLLVTAVNAANITIFDKAQQDQKLKGMGTTIVAALVQGSTAHIVHVGDSRAYLIGRENIQQLTTDHTVVQFLIESGELSPQEAAAHPNKHLITRAVGVGEQLQADYTQLQINPDERILMCTDGLTNHVSEAEIAKLCQGEPQQCVKQLVDLANQNGRSAFRTK